MSKATTSTKEYECLHLGKVQFISENMIITWATDMAGVILNVKYSSFEDNHDDFKQAAIEAVLQALPNYVPTGEIKAYISTCINYRIRDEAKKIINYRKRVQALSEELLQECTCDDLDNHIDARAFIKQLTDELTATERRVVELNLDGYTDDEIAVTLKMPSSERKSVMNILWGGITLKAQRIKSQKDKEDGMAVNTAKIKGLMAQNDDTQQNIADLIGVSRYTVNKMLKSDDWRVSDLAKIAEHYGLTVKDLLK